MPVIDNYTKIDIKGRLRNLIEYSCIECNKISISRKDVFKYRNGKCKDCVVKESSIKNQKQIDFEQVCTNIMFDRFNKRYAIKGYYCNIQGEDLRNLLKSNCHYCGTEPSNVMHYKQKYFSYYFYYNGLDRVDSKKGYIIGNVVPCCKRCNLAKSDMGYQEFINHIDKIYKYLNNASH